MRPYQCPFPLTGVEVEFEGMTYRTFSAQDHLQFRSLADSTDAEDLRRLRAAVSSKEASVAVRAGRALALRGDRESLPSLTALRARVGARYAADVDAALEQLGAPVEGEADPADVDDE